MMARLRSALGRLIREPLMQLFLAGGLLYILYAAATGDGEPAAEREIRVTRAEVGWLASTWEARPMASSSSSSEVARSSGWPLSAHGEGGARVGAHDVNVDGLMRLIVSS
jgi:hypothetical protein